MINTMLNQKILFEKYRKIFVRLHIIECEQGWFTLLDKLCSEIQREIDRDPYNIPQVHASQVKEKFGGLRFYYSGGNQKIAALVQEGERLSVEVCEQCGDKGKIRNASWIRTLCNRCWKISPLHPTINGRQ